MSFAPLDGIRVLDLTSSLAGPTCTQILGALGADVVKVEHPQRGDEARAWGPQFFDGGSVMFFAANASKRSLALDVKSSDGKEALLRLVDRSDVFIQSMRPRPPTTACSRSSASRSAGRSSPTTRAFARIRTGSRTATSCCP